MLRPPARFGKCHLPPITAYPWISILASGTHGHVVQTPPLDDGRCGSVEKIPASSYWLSRRLCRTRCRRLHDGRLGLVIPRRAGCRSGRSSNTLDRSGPTSVVIFPVNPLTDGRHLKERSMFHNFPTSPQGVERGVEAIDHRGGQVTSPIRYSVT